MYKTLIRSHLDYCDMIYQTPAVYSQNGMILQGLTEQIEKFQYQEALSITGTWQGTNRNKIYEELGWESLSERRWFRRLIRLYKMNHN